MTYPTVHEKPCGKKTSQASSRSPRAGDSSFSDSQSQQHPSCPVVSGIPSAISSPPIRERLAGLFSATGPGSRNSKGAEINTPSRISWSVDSPFWAPSLSPNWTAMTMAGGDIVAENDRIALGSPLLSVVLAMKPALAAPRTRETLPQRTETSTKGA
ncbi:hypothetical protein CIHG_09601 [Coccidioides immitis H538.4]|uniref:Uncharacterized protein n=1 Tax=Coccidioides immitis H538.4 TaxID=396776 RepID=A0A0J8S3X9_COCIT|nr:hypothetical protein CIHG_09601 [Coccidioides immitis H538.4]